jgi:aryl-alcohol dehydrogenase-like predicted oxidoreductase
MAQNSLDPLMENKHESKLTGMGCWQLGGASQFAGRTNGYGEMPESIARATVQAAYDSGIRFFDTAEGYGWGRSEQILGDTLFGVRNDVVFCTKFGAREDPEGKVLLDLSSASIERALSGSLKRLRTDHVDILLIHNPPDDMNWDEFDRTGFDEAVKDGRIGAYGISARSFHGARNAVDAGFGTFVEVVFNALDRRAATLHEAAKRNGQRIIGRVPLASGFLSDRTLLAPPQFPSDDIRSTFPADQVDWLVSAVRSLKFLNDLPGGIAASATRFAVFHPAMHVAIPGLRSPEQVRKNQEAIQLGPLPKEVQKAIEDAVPEVFHKWR